jgi:hypothetical protein
MRMRCDKFDALLLCQDLKNKYLNLSGHFILLWQKRNCLVRYFEAVKAKFLKRCAKRLIFIKIIKYV